MKGRLLPIGDSRSLWIGKGRADCPLSLCGDMLTLFPIMLTTWR